MIESYIRVNHILRMKSFVLVSVAICIFSGTSLTATAQKRVNSSNTENKSPKFIEGIEIKAEKAIEGNNQQTEPVIISEQPKTTAYNAASVADIENFSPIQFKYALLMNRTVESIKNLSLYQFIDEWWQTRYRYGGTGKKGIDCSALTGLLMSTVFAVKLPRTAREQYQSTSKIDREDMEEGDLVFFNTRGGVSHVGVYLGDGYFVHASRNNGVIISSLDEAYYSNRFLGGGRVLEQSNVAFGH